MECPAGHGRKNTTSDLKSGGKDGRDPIDHSHSFLGP